MKVYELAKLLEAECLTSSVSLEREVTSGYACDLLSWVMTHAKRGAAWITVQTHINVVAVASLTDLACIIIPENIPVGQESINKAIEEGIPIIRCVFSSYSICGLMTGMGVR